ncbi:MAG: DUF2281 domain-containing protein [Treponema sp.]|jgi:hypothetical protein|nr:DUF2281 domain-containing protein [Treponema sp.]
MNTSVVLPEKARLLPPQIQRQVLDYVDFLLSKYAGQNPQKPRAGCMKGTFVWMSDDFNAPLDDFKDYQ